MTAPQRVVELHPLESPEREAARPRRRRRLRLLGEEALDEGILGIREVRRYGRPAASRVDVERGHLPVRDPADAAVSKAQSIQALSVARGSAWCCRRCHPEDSRPAPDFHDSGVAYITG